VHVFVKRLAFVVDNKWRVLYRHRPRNLNAFVDVVKQTDAVSQEWVIKQCRPYALTDILFIKGNGGIHCSLLSDCTVAFIFVRFVRMFVFLTLERHAQIILI